MKPSPTPREGPYVPNPCSVCDLPIYGSFIGTGDGTMKNGGIFAHPECYWRDRAHRVEADLYPLLKAVRGWVHARAYGSTIEVLDAEHELNETFRKVAGLE